MQRGKVCLVSQVSISRKRVLARLLLRNRHAARWMRQGPVDSGGSGVLSAIVKQGLLACAFEKTQAAPNQQSGRR